MALKLANTSPYMQAQWQQIDIPLEKVKAADQRPLSVKIGKKLVCLAYYQEKIWALRARCTHQGGPLDKGKIVDGKLVCPWHRFGFALQNGQCEQGGYFVKIYETKIEEGKLWIKVPKRKWLW